jgi:hypothetical protein
MVDAGSLARGNLLDIQAQAAREELQLINLQQPARTVYTQHDSVLELESPAGFDIVTPKSILNRQPLQAEMLISSGQQWAQDPRFWGAEKGLILQVRY